MPPIRIEEFASRSKFHASEGVGIYYKVYLLFTGAEGTEQKFTEYLTELAKEGL